MVTARRAASRRSRRRALQQLRREGLGRDPYEASEAALVLVAALGAHDRRTRGHSERVRTLADLLAKEAGVPDDDRDKLRWGALLHDIGKLSVPGAILNKPDRPDEEEWATLKRHPEEGAHLVEPLETWLGPWAGSVGHHHERWDGKGYPLGLAGEDISLGGRILAIADAYEVMTAARAYKVPMSAAAARKELVASAGTHFDPALVRAFMGISIGALWWTSGVAALLAQIPLLGRVGAAPGLDQVRSGLAGAATAVVTVTALVAAGVVGGGSEGDPAVSRREAAQSAAAGAPPATPVPTTEPVPEPAPGGGSLRPTTATTEEPYHQPPGDLTRRPAPGDRPSGDHDDHDRSSRRRAVRPVVAAGDGPPPPPGRPAAVHGPGPAPRPGPARSPRHRPDQPRPGRRLWPVGLPGSRRLGLRAPVRPPPAPAPRSRRPAATSWDSTTSPSGSSARTAPFWGSWTLQRLTRLEFFRPEPATWSFRTASGSGRRSR